MIVLVLCMAILFGGLSVLTAFAEDSVTIYDKSVLRDGVNDVNAKTVSYGGYEWYVIGYDGRDGDGGDGTLSPSGTMTLIAKDRIGDDVIFDNTDPYENKYASSDLRTAIETIYSGFLSSVEKSAIQTRMLSNNGGTCTSGAECDCINGDVVEDAALWPLSLKEANSMNSYLRTFSVAWWLRSPGFNDTNAAVVTPGGRVFFNGAFVNDNLGVRPAFYVNLDSVLFTSEISSSSGYKLALIKDALTVNNPTFVSLSDYVATITYDDTSEGLKHLAIVVSSTGTDETPGTDMRGTYVELTDDKIVSFTIPESFRCQDYSIYVAPVEKNVENNSDYVGAWTKIKDVLLVREIIEPTAVKSLVYDKTEKTLVTEGSVTCASVSYALGSESESPVLDSDIWSSTIPTGTLADSYHVWWCASGTNYQKNPEMVTVNINPKPVGLAWNTTNFIRTGVTEPPTATATGVVEGDTVAVTVTGSQIENAYTATVDGLTGEDASNYFLPSENTVTYTIQP